jgi:hypothetical protein
MCENFVGFMDGKFYHEDSELEGEVFANIVGKRQPVMRAGDVIV